METDAGFVLKRPQKGGTVILLINRSESLAEQVKRQIEFMDVPTVITASPQDWRHRVSDTRVDAIFIGPDLPRAEIQPIFDEIAALDPNIPIVLMSQQDTD